MELRQNKRFLKEAQNHKHLMKLLRICGKIMVLNDFETQDLL